MSREDGYGIVVVGGGPADVTAALRARELGASVAPVERGNMGGTCTNDGCVPTRVLAHAARLARDAEQFGDYGLIGAAPRVDFVHPTFTTIIGLAARQIIRDLDPASSRRRRASGRSGAAEWEHSERE